jgi:dTDP-4-amino-4,6-dideoxygalactose transaminase
MSSIASLPALLGGSPLRPGGPPSWPQPDESVHQALEAAYQNGSWGKYHGPHVEKLEEAVARYHGVDFAMTCASGTYAVELALRALKVGANDEVILAAYDYGGNFLDVHALGARPVLVDVQADNWNLLPARLVSAIGPATKAIVASHLHGGLVPMQQVMEIARAHSLVVVEDAAQAPGGRVQGKKAGTWGDVGIWSFGGSKLLTAGRGGALFTRQADVYQRARLLQNRANLVAPLSELQAAVLLPQLDRLDERNDRRSRAVAKLSQLLREIPGLRPFASHLQDSQPGYYKLGLQFDADVFGLARDRFVAAVRAEGVGVDEGFRALHMGRSATRFRHSATLTEAERAHKGVVVLHHPVLLGDDADLELVAQAIRKAHQHVDRLRRLTERGGDKPV